MTVSSLFVTGTLIFVAEIHFESLSLLEAHNSIFKYDIIPLCETSLNETIVIRRNSLETNNERLF